MAEQPVTDPFAGRRPLGATGPLAAFAEAGVLEAGDVHVAAAIDRLSPDGPTAGGELVALAAAFAVRAVRMGSVTVDVATIAQTAATEDVDIDLSELPWPDPDEWLAALAHSAAVTVGDAASGPADRPIRLVGTDVSLTRYWRLERFVADDLTRRATASPAPTDRDSLETSARRLFPDTPEQADAAVAAAGGRLTVVAGGPGTGKTTTVAGILALLRERDGAGTAPRIALAAPTGKAAARLQEAVRTQAATLDVSADTRAWLEAVEASTIHRLLGRRGGSDTRFRHDRRDPLPHQVVVVDETSMVPLTLMARLLDAVRPDARLVLVGDPRQLTSVEAGAVLGDLVGPALVENPDPSRPPIAGCIHVLRRVHRYAGGVAELARSIEAGDADRVLDVLARQPDGVCWIDADVHEPDGRAAAETIRAPVVERATEVVERAGRGDAAGALSALRGIQVLCAHRRGPAGVATWRAQIERWLAETVPGVDHRGWYAGRPVLVTENDYSLSLFNGDTGVVVATDDGLACAFDRHGEVVLVPPTRLAAVETLYAMTIHKSQGSQFGHVIALLPGADSKILTRELLYTAVTRAEDSVTVVGTREAIGAATDRPVHRASGLAGRLWGPGAPDAPG